MFLSIRLQRRNDRGFPNDPCLLCGGHSPDASVAAVVWSARDADAEWQPLDVVVCPFCLQLPWALCLERAQLRADRERHRADFYARRAERLEAFVARPPQLPSVVEFDQASVEADRRSPRICEVCGQPHPEPV